MTGLPEFNYPAFRHAAERLRADGIEVISPAELFQGQLGLPYDQYIREGLRQLLLCDTIYILTGWARSKGALLEIHVAEVLGLNIVYESDQA